MTSDHRRLDLRSLALHRAVADALRRDPSLIAVPRANLERWGKTLEGSWIAEWTAILDGPFDALLAFLIEDSETATRLRQSSPFTGVISSEERARIYADYSEVRIR